MRRVMGTAWCARPAGLEGRNVFGPGEETPVTSYPRSRMRLELVPQQVARGTSRGGDVGDLDGGGGVAAAPAAAGAAGGEARGPGEALAERGRCPSTMADMSWRSRT